MAQPAAVQKLKHGKALCGKTFGKFVETFNWLVDFCLSIQGDADVNNANGTITVDRADPSAPVIRATMPHANGAGPSGEDEEEEEEPVEPGEDPDEPYEDPEDSHDDDPEGMNGDGNEISTDDNSFSEDGSGDYCNRIAGLNGGADNNNNYISYTCSK